MTASHIAIAHDARGPNNSIVLGDVSSLLAVAEAASVIRRGWADVMLTGGTGCRLHPTALVARGDAAALAPGRRLPAGPAAPSTATATASSTARVPAAIVLESRAHAERRGATIRGRLLWPRPSRCEPKRPARRR